VAVDIGSLKDIFPGTFIAAVRDGDGKAVPCLVTFADARVIRARVITIQEDLEFDVRTGRGDCGDGGYACRAKLISNLPEGVRQSLVSIDRKYRLRNAPEGSKLLKHEIHALLFFGEHFDEPDPSTSLN
jgi:hypothetical protein